MALKERHEKTYSKRRRHKDRFFGIPPHRRLIRVVERVNKFLWTGLLGKMLRVKHVADPLDPYSVQSMLFIRNDAIGDMVLTTPVWRAVKQQFPHIRIGVAGSFRNLPLLEHDPNVDRIFDASEGDWKAMWNAKKQIAKEKWDLVMPMVYYRQTRQAVVARFLAPHSISSTLVPFGEDVEKRRKLFSLVVESPYRSNEIEMIEQMRVHLMGVLTMQIAHEDWKPALYPNPDAVRRVNDRIKDLLESDTSSQYFHINLEAKTAFKEYGMNASLELSRKLIEEFPEVSILWTSSPQAAQEIEAFLKEQRVPSVHYFKTGSLHELLALVKGAALVVTPDTSIVHIASAFNRPVVALYPVRHEWPPYKTPNRLLIAEREQPVSSIPVGTVLEACLELLAEHRRQHGNERPIERMQNTLSEQA